MHFLVCEISRVKLNPDFVEIAVVMVFAATVIITIFVNLRDYLIFKIK